MNVGIATSLCIAAIALGGCGSVNTVSTRTTATTDSVEPLRKQINDVLTDFFLHCTDVRLSRTQGGPLQAQVDVANDDFRYRRFAYRFTWMDPNGNTIASPISVWKSASIASGGSKTLMSVAPNDIAADFSLEIRRSN